MRTNVYGQAIVSGDQLRELLLQGKHIGHLNVENDEEVQLFERYQKDILSETVLFLDKPGELMPFDEFQTKRADEWLFPLEFQTIDVYNWLITRCKTQAEIERVNQEYTLYEEKDLVMVLRLFIYLISYFREKKYIWGVGRGSAVSSFCLYLIGVHHVNPLVYGFDIKDYLK